MIMLAIATVSVVAMALTENQVPATAQPNTVKPLTPRSTPTATSPTLGPVPAGSTVMFIGDSWTHGTGADDPATQGYPQTTAAALGVEADVYGYGSVGYVSTGVDKQGAFQTRLAADQPAGRPSLIVLQGSLNDAKESPAKITEAAAALVTDVRGKFPQAQVVMVGPAPATEGLINVLAPIDTALSQAATAQEVPYISPLREQWFSAGNLAGYMNPMDGSPHPNNAGHKLFGEKLAAAIKQISGV